MMQFLERTWIDLKTQPSRWILGLVLFFMFFPGFDIWISRQFYQPGVGFTWDDGGLLEFVRAAIPVIILGAFVFAVALWVAGIWYEQWFWGMTTNRAIYLMLTLIIGPGLIVESLLKPNWGRARPKDLTIFGGQADYTPPLWVADDASVIVHLCQAMQLSPSGFQRLGSSCRPNGACWGSRVAWHSARWWAGCALSRAGIFSAT